MPGSIPDPSDESAIVDAGNMSSSMGGCSGLAESYGQQMRRSGSMFEDLGDVVEDEWLLRTEDSSHSFADLMENAEAGMNLRCGAGYLPCSDGVSTWCEPRLSPPSMSRARSAVPKQHLSAHQAKVSVQQLSRCKSAVLASADQCPSTPTA